MRIGVQIVTALLWLSAPGLVFAQAAPTRAGAASTPAQDERIQQGVQLHDQGKLAEAIALYEGVLKENADNMTALYELSYSVLEEKEYARAIELATRGTTYTSEQLPMFYDIIASAHDLMGNPQKAIETYARGIAVVPTAGLLYYNRGVTELESLKNPDAARVSFEKAIAIDPLQPAAHLMLGQVMQSNGYSVPSFFAFSMALILEPGGPQALRAYGFMRTVLRAGLSNDPKQNQAMTGGMRTPPRPSTSKTDEGDYRQVEAALAVSHQKLLAQLDERVPELQALRDQIDALLTQLSARNLAAERSFTGRHYLPFFVELKKRGFVEPFVNWSIQRAPVEGARQWVQANQPQVKAFIEWLQAYQWPKP